LGLGSAAQGEIRPWSEGELPSTQVWGFALQQLDGGIILHSYLQLKEHWMKTRPLATEGVYCS